MKIKQQSNVCGVNPATKRCSKTGTQNRNLCELSEKNRCRKKKYKEE